MSKPEDQTNQKIELWSKDKIPKAILGFAREMRKNPTEAEELLWKSLRGGRLNKLKFRRQQPLKGKILDFYCEEVRLGVEVDGEIHFTDEQKNYDRLRTDFLAEYGIKIIRFTNDQVINKMKEVLSSIKEEAGKRNPSPLPLSQGRGVSEERGRGEGLCSSILLSLIC